MVFEPSEAIVLSAGPNGLGALRGLYLAKISVDTIAYADGDAVMYSSLARQKIALSADNKATQLLALLLQWPERAEPIVIIPSSDWFVDFLQQHRNQLSDKFLLVIPKPELSVQLIDKQKEVYLLQDVLPLPKTITHLPDNADDLLQQLALPLIIKPRSNELNQLGKKNIPVYSLQALTEFYQQYHEVISNCIAQQLIEGADENLWVCNATFDQQHQLVNAFTFQRQFLSPPHFGVTTYAVSKYNQTVIDQVRLLGEQLGYVGPIMVEFKFDPTTGQYVYIETNPRLGLCNYFDSYCGKNNVYASYCVALGKPIYNSPQAQREGVIFHSVYEDSYARYRDGQSPWKIISRYWYDIAKPHCFLYFTWFDPLPSLAIGFKQLTKTFKALGHKVLGKMHHG